jgi:hypothetical protein
MSDQNRGFDRAHPCSFRKSHKNRAKKKFARRRTSSRSGGLAFESLESRMLLAGDVVFNVNIADLDFILKQIQIAEDSSEAYTPATPPKTILQSIMDTYGLSAADAAIAPFGLRTVDGSFNSLVPGQSHFGASNTLFPRLTTPVYRNEGDDNLPGVTGNNNYGLPGNVVDADPRIISNLVVDMSITNPAAIEAYFSNPLSLEQFAEDHPIDPLNPALGSYEPVRPGQLTDPLTQLEVTSADLQTIPNLSPDIGLSPGFNSWMTFFGQFFDHGLDLVTKGGNGTVYVPLQPDDPLILVGPDGVPGTNDELTNPALQFMALTRATPKTVDGVTGQENTTTSFVDQNQTYTSHPSHQVFLREYATVAGKTVSTGKMLDGSTASGSVAGAIGNWAEVKAQALQFLGIRLTDFDVHNLPLLRTDAYGKFIPHPTTGYARVVVGAGADLKLNTADDVVVQGTPAAPVNLATTVVQRTGHAFLNDIAHHASPSFVDFNHDGIKNGADYDQVPDANIDRNGDGVYNFADLDVNGNSTVTVAEIASLVADVNHDGVVNLADVDRDSSGTLTSIDFDIDGNGIVNAADLVADDKNSNTYDNELLNVHFATGDGRGNENIALTTVHSIFHSEHNRLVDANKATIAAVALTNPTFVRSWLTNGATANMADQNTWVWDGERLFQAARFATEMQYQHMVFEEFARRIQPAIDPFIFNTSPEVDPSIVAEFAHTVYRFGHSMLTGTVDRLDNNLNLLNGDLDQQTLLAVFLNPLAYTGSGADLEEINGNIIRGLSRDVGNLIDEFIVNNVRTNLLGLPLDLAVLNLSRGRETGIPSLNQARAQLYNSTGLADLAPYNSWFHFALNLKNASSIVNFIAAYGTHDTITSQPTLAGKRAAAEAIVFGGVGAPADRVAFLTGSDAYAGGAAAAGTKGGLSRVDLWLGGLAEKSPEFGGMLGTTFNFVFESQMENLQNGDRLYYLTRTQGTNFLNNLEPNSFADIVMRNTALGETNSTHINGQLFVTPDHIIELDRGIAQTDYNGAAPGNDPIWDGSDPALEAILGPKVVRTYSTDPAPYVPGTHDVGGFLRVLGGEHFVLGGTEGADTIFGDTGIDTLWGDGGNDYLNGMTESDDVWGGPGDDVIEDPFGDDVIRGNEGNDVVTSARGLDLLFGNQDQDFIVGGQDAVEVFGGTGSDFILGGAGQDFLMGNEGDDWIEGAAGFDTIAGENTDLFFNSPIIGHDVMFGQGDEQDYDAESGDDIMGSGASVYRYEGMFGFDWGIGKGDNAGVRFDLQIPIFTTVPADILRDRFDLVEGVSGYQFGDVLDGDDRGSALAAILPVGTGNPLDFVNHVLTQEGINRIDGFNAWFAGARATLDALVGVRSIDANGDPVIGVNPFLDGTNFRDGNILIGGDGNEFIQGRGGNDLIDGDAWLNVRIKIVIPSGPNAGTYSAESLNTDTSVAGEFAGLVFNTDANGNPIFTSPAFGGRSLSSLMLDRTINPGQLSIVREIKYDDTNLTGLSASVDTAVYRGNYAEYDIEGRITTGPDGSGTVLRKSFDVNGDGFISVHDRDNGVVGATVGGVTLVSRKVLTDGTDLIKNIEQLQFADRLIDIYEDPPEIDLHALIIGNYREEFGTTSYTAPDTANATTPWTTSWAESGDVTSGTISTGGQIRISNNQLVFGDNDNDSGLGNATIQRTIDLSGVTTATLSYSFNENSFDLLENVAVYFAADGVNFGLPVQLITSVSGNGNFSTPLTGPFTANSAIRFVVGLTNNNSSNDTVSIDNINIAFTTIVNDGSNNYATTYTEDAAAVALSNGPLITDIDSTNLQSAKFVLTNAKPGDALSISGSLPGGISSSTDLSVAGVITLNLTGSATLAAYQTAVSSVRFASTSQNPDTTPRTINVTVNDGAVNSNVATATVTVVAVDDPATANDDRLLINVANTNFVIPEWAFLANDSDPDSALDITAVSNSNGLGNLSLSTNPGSITLSDTGSANGSFTYTAGGDTANVAVVLDTGTMNGNSSSEVIVDGAGVNNTLSGSGGNDIILAGDGNDTVVGGTGNDRVFGEIGNDIFTYTMGDGADAVDGGPHTTGDILNIGVSGSSANDILDVIFNGTSLTNFEGGTIVDVESVTANLNSGTDTLNYAGTSVPVAVNLGTSTASGFTTITSIENVTGGSAADALTGSTGGNVLNGGDGGDILIGGDGSDTINTGVANDDVPDFIRWSAAAELGDGDTVNNFDASGTAAQIDRIEFSGALNTQFDDGTVDDIVNFFTGNGANGGNTAVNLATVEALFLDGSNGEGVSSSGSNSLDNSGDVASEFNAEFSLTAANGESTLLVINDTNANSAAVWQWVQAGGGEISSGELTLIALINANATITVGSFGFVSPLLAASAGQNPNADVLTAQQADSLLAAALGHWQASGVSTPAPGAIVIRIADLGGTTLGLASGRTIWLDDNAAGWGWFVDSTPSDDSEFLLNGNQGEQNRIDLLTVLAHELGHVLGFEHEADGVMAETLAAGTRQTESKSELEATDAFFEMVGDNDREI